jgi:hypothetical protein
VHYNPWYVARLRKPATIYVDGNDNIIFISLYGGFRARKTNPNYDKHWWKKYNVTPIECRQDGENVLYVLYNENGSPKETNEEFELPEEKYAISYIDEYEDEHEATGSVDEYELYDKIRDYVQKEVDKERPYRYHNKSIEPILSLPNKMTIKDTTTNKTCEISYRLIDTVATSVADKNNGFATIGDVCEELIRAVIKALSDN